MIEHEWIGGLPIHWVRRGRNFWSSQFGRFDIFLGVRDWVVLDNDFGGIYVPSVRHFRTLREAKDACEKAMRSDVTRFPPKGVSDDDCQ